MNQNPYSVSEQQSFGDLQSLGPKFDEQLRVMQIIAVALMMGVLMFFGVVLVITKGDVFGQNRGSMLTVIAAAFAGVIVVSQLVVPSIIANAQLRMLKGSIRENASAEARTSSLVSVYQVQLIVGLALLEGAAFFNLVVLITDKHVVSTVLVACLLLFMVLRFPTRTKVSWWVQNRLSEFS